MTADDERAIGAVLVRYATGIDLRDWQLFASCFTTDLVADYGSFGTWRGRDVFVDFMEEGHGNVGETLHRMTNIVVTGEEDHASATSYVDAVLLPAQAGGMTRRALGRYEDQLIRSSGEWKISSRRFIAVSITSATT